MQSSSWHTKILRSLLHRVGPGTSWVRSNTSKTDTCQDWHSLTLFQTRWRRPVWRSINQSINPHLYRALFRSPSECLANFSRIRGAGIRQVASRRRCQRDACLVRCRTCRWMRQFWLWEASHSGYVVRRLWMPWMRSLSCFWFSQQLFIDVVVDVSMLAMTSINSWTRRRRWIRWTIYCGDDYTFNTSSYAY